MLCGQKYMCRTVAACGALSKPSTRPHRAASCLYLVGWLAPTPFPFLCKPCIQKMPQLLSFTFTVIMHCIEHDLQKSFISIPWSQNLAWLRHVAETLIARQTHVYILDKKNGNITSLFNSLFCLSICSIFWESSSLLVLSSINFFSLLPNAFSTSLFLSSKVWISWINDCSPSPVCLRYCRFSAWERSSCSRKKNYTRATYLFIYVNFIHKVHSNLPVWIWTLWLCEEKLTKLYSIEL